jgi:hypothetical protein
MRIVPILAFAIAIATASCGKNESNEPKIEPGGCRIDKQSAFGVFAFGQLNRFVDSNRELCERLVKHLNEDRFYGGQARFFCQCGDAP